MNNLVIFGLIVLSIVRVFGFFVSVDLYVNLRSNRYVYLLSGWACWFLAGIFPLLADIAIDSFLAEMFKLLNYMFVTLGAFLIVLGITNIFRTFDPKRVTILIAILVIIPIATYVSAGNRLVSIFSSTILFVSYFIAMILDSLIGEDFKEKVGNSYKWIILLRIVVTLQILVLFFAILTGSSYGLYDSTDSLLIVVNYGIGITLTLVMLILIIHFEHSVISYQKDFLKDTLTHDIGNILQIISSATEMLSVPEKSQEKTELILRKSAEASKLINDIKDL
ncbi:MAG: hypothetical protein ACW98F_14595 [Candidatus Hodarchaeales archaeon]|jgi:hypothetical protein